MIQYYGCSDVFFQIVRIGLLAALIIVPILLIEVEDDKQKWTVIAGSVLGGSVVNYTILVLFDVVMWYTAGCEALGPFDAIFLLDDERNVSNVVGALTFEKFEFERMRDHLLKKTEDLHRCRSKLVKKFGIYWFQRMTEEEWAKNKDVVIVHVKDIHNEK